MKKVQIIISGILLPAVFLCGCRSAVTTPYTEPEVIQQETKEDKLILEEPASIEEPAETADAEETEEIITEDAKASVTLVMVGDMLMHTPVNQSGIMEDGSIDFSHLFSHTKELIESADVALVNQEVILGGEELGISGYPNFNTYHELGDALADAGFDIVLHATNHALDKGKKGLTNCLAYWDNNHPDMAVLGIYDSFEERDTIYVCEKNGIRIAFFNYTYGTNGIPIPEDMPYAVNLINKEQIAEDIRKAEEISDFVVVCPHWGTEYVLMESDYQRKYAEFFLDCGVDLVIGTHPHVIEPIEWLEDENGNRMLVYYSLGNYVNCTSAETEEIGQRMLGAMAEVTITKEPAGNAYISEYGAQPLVTYVSDTKETIAVYPLEQFTDEMADSSYTIKFDTDFSKSYCEELWEKVIGE